MLGGNPRTTYAPTTLEPTNNFYYALQTTKQALDIEGKKLTLQIPFKEPNRNLQVIFGLRRYLSCVCLSIKIQPFEVEDLANIHRMQDLHTHRELYKIASKILAITISGNTKQKQLTNPPKIFPITKIISQNNKAQATEHQLVELVTRHTIERNEIITANIKKNALHQIDKTLILLDRQGIVSYIPYNCSEPQIRGNFQRLKNASSLMEFAYGIKRDLISNSLPAHNIKNITENAKYFLPDSISAQRMWELLVTEHSLKDELNLKLTPMHESNPNLQSDEPETFKNVTYQYISSDQYNIYGQAAAVGPSSTALRNTLHQTPTNTPTYLNMRDLALDLKILAKAMEVQATQPQHLVAISKILSAEQAAISNDETLTLLNLKLAGEWPLEIASKTNRNTASRAILIALYS